jgi:prepilin-type N-terminal cleavage/methylation domain-containing protein
MLYSGHMKRGHKGFTIAEVLIALAITGLLLASAYSLIGGQTGQASFQQSLNDIRSKMVSTVQNISNGILPDAKQYTCKVASDTSRPKLTVGVGGVGSNQSCIFLGRAIQVSKDAGTLNIYTVLGRRSISVDADTGLPSTGENSENIAVRTFEEANPTPATVDAAGADLIETYRPSGGAYLTAARFINSSGTVDSREAALAGFYNDPGGGDVTGSLLIAKTYLVNSNGANTSNITKCVEENGCTPSPLTKWILCYKDSSKSRNAVITATSGATGIITDLKYEKCPVPGS